MSDWKRNRLSVEELLTKLENNLHQCRLTGHQAKTLLRLVRAADDLFHADREGGTLAERVMARVSYRKLREGGNSPRESDDQREDGT